MVGVMNDSLALISRLSAGKMAANASSFVCRVSRLPEPGYAAANAISSYCSYIRLWYLIENPTKISHSFMHNQTKISF